MANKSASVLARLKNISKSKGISLQQLLNLFCQEELIRRISTSDYKENLILKGGYLLYSISSFTTRPTIDADYLLENYSNDIESIESLIMDIISRKDHNNFIEFSIRNFEEIGGTRDYPGVRVNLMGKIGKTKTPFSVDFGVGDVIVPSSVERELPVILEDFAKPRILTYSLESTVAEKLDAIIYLMEATSRMKDFYDIYYLASNFNFEGQKLQDAIFKTLTNRLTPHDDKSITAINRLKDSQQIQIRWKSFCKKVLHYDLDFNYVVEIIVDFTYLPYKSMREGRETIENWSYENVKYF